MSRIGFCEMFFKERHNTADILLAILEVRTAVIGLWHHPQGFGILSCTIEQGRIMGINHSVAPSVDEQKRARAQSCYGAQRLDLAEAVSGTESQQQIAQPEKRLC